MSNLKQMGMNLSSYDNEKTHYYHNIEELTPCKIVAELDKFIIGQDDAKRAVGYFVAQDQADEAGPAFAKASSYAKAS